MRTDVLAARDVTFGYRKALFSSLNLALGPGLTVLLGPNGAGKTTLLRVLLGALKPWTGEVFYGDQPLSRLSSRQKAAQVAYVPQSHGYAFSYRACDMVALGAYRRQPFWKGGDGVRAQARAVMEELGIGSLAERPFDRLSGGEAQMTLIARALFQRPRALLLDEITAHLDLSRCHDVMERVRALADEGLSLFMTSHDPALMWAYADRLVMFRDGRLIFDGPPGDEAETSLEQLYGRRFKIVKQPGWTPALVTKKEAL